MLTISWEQIFYLEHCTRQQLTAFVRSSATTPRCSQDSLRLHNSQRKDLLRNAQDTSPSPHGHILLVAHELKQLSYNYWNATLWYETLSSHFFDVFIDFMPMLLYLSLHLIQDIRVFLDLNKDSYTFIRDITNHFQYQWRGNYNQDSRMLLLTCYRLSWQNYST